MLLGYSVCVSFLTLQSLCHQDCAPLRPNSYELILYLIRQTSVKPLSQDIFLSTRKKSIHADAPGRKLPHPRSFRRLGFSWYLSRERNDAFTAMAQAGLFS